jgi:hypothetical protein
MYIVAYLSLFDGKLKQQAVEAESAYDAAIKLLEIGYLELSEFRKSYPTLHTIINDYCPNTDSYLSVYSLKTGEVYD